MRILYLDLDTLRPDHLGCYGYHRDTSPNIDRIAREGVRFTDHYASDVPCCPSRTALMTGQFGIHTGLVSHGGTAGDVRLEGRSRGFRDRLGRESLPAFLRELGYYTASISPFAERHGAWTFHAGFNETLNTGKCGMESAEDVTPSVSRWLDNHASEDHWFLHVNYWDPHVPFRAPEAFGNPFDNEPLPAWLTEASLEAQKARIGVQMPRKKQEVFKRYAGGTRHGVACVDLPPLPRNPLAIQTLDDVRMIVDGYDCGIRYMDDHLGRLFDQLASLGVMDETAVIISSDHGENLGELGIYGDHITSDAITHRIPMIVKWPGARAGHVDRGLHYNLDLAPTLAELHDREPLAAWDGSSFAASIRDAEDTGRGELVLSTCAGTCQRSVRFSRWHYIRTFHDGYNLFPDEMLFDVETDPHEERDLAMDNPDVCRDASWRLLNWHTDMMRTMPHGCDTDPLWTMIQEGGPSHVRGALPDYLKMLEELGEHEAAEALRRRHPREQAGITGR